ncbi:uncharacterized protein LOC119838503 isoform X1 [Zerene cesonia]|uniref:uncharacterized protein LOC119838503 isoform X1 n=1 Tax=Zerene cesonia TaxID=33412 RepID=UPI0018E542CE|nr:uncharacterized protein LOC119838503 isoform X1 [Zerene cesonia]
MKYDFVYKHGQTTPALDDYEGIYTVESANINQTSQEIVEVSAQINQPFIQEFPKALNSYKALKKQYKPFTGSVKFPFLNKPLNLEDNVKDELVNNVHAEETKFKQTEYYDEDIKRKEKELAVKTIVERLKFVQSLTNSRAYERYRHEFKKSDVEEKIDRSFKQEKKEVKKIQKIEKLDKPTSKCGTDKSDLQTIKMTAFDIVDENIKRAVSVAEEIKREIDVELTDKRQTLEKGDKIDDNKLKSSGFQKQSFKKTDKEIKESSLKTLTKRSAFNLGLQTIPYMKSYMESNYFKTIIIKTIFLHLTKFLVSLSRYMLSKQKSIKQIYDYNKQLKTGEYMLERQDEEYYEDRILSGAEMSRKFGKTPLEFTEKMDKVIIEMEGETRVERSRSRSRSRVTESTTCNEWEYEKKTELMEELVRKFYYAYVLYVQWSEYYDLGKTKQIEERLEASTKEIMKKEIFEKELMEKVIKEETPLTYVAVVESHVYPNEEAIRRDTLKRSEQVESIAVDVMKKDNIVINKKEQTATCTDLQHQIIEIRKEKPIEKVVVVESIEDITPIDEEKPLAFFEKGITEIAVQNTTEVLEPVVEIKSEQTQLKQAHSSIEKSSVVIASNEGIVLQEDKDEEFVIPDIRPRKSITMIEPALKIVAETSDIVIAEPRLEIIEITEEPSKTLMSVIEEPVKTIAQTTEVQIHEIQTEPLEEIKSIKEMTKTTIEPVTKPVAEVFETIINQPKTETIECIDVKQEMPKVLFEPLSKSIAETNIVKTDEANVSKFVESIPKSANVKSSVETPTKVVAQRELFIDVENTQILDNLKIKEEFSDTLVETPSHTVAMQSETFLDEMSVELHAQVDVKRESIKNIFEQPIQTVAQKHETYVETADLSTLEKIKKTEENTRYSIETPTKSVAETGEVDVIFADIGLYNVDKVKAENTVLAIETSFKSIADILEPDTNEENIQQLDKLNFVGEKIAAFVETPSKVVAETSQTVINESSADLFGTAITNIENTNNKVETPQKIVAQMFETYVNDSSKEFEKFHIKSSKLEAAIENTVKTIAETNETYIDEAVGVIGKFKLSEEKLKSDFETQLKTVAQTNVTLTDEISGIFKSDKLKTDNPSTLIESPIKSVAVSCETLLNEAGSKFVEKTTIQENSNIAIEVPFKTVANKIEISANEEIQGVVEKFDVKMEISKPSIDINFKPVAEISNKILSESSAEMEIKEFKTNTPKMLMDDSLRFVAEAIIPFIEEPRSEALETPKIINAEAKLAIDNFEPTTITEVLPAEPNQEPFEVQEVKNKIPSSTLEEPLLPVAETIYTCTEGPKDDIFNVPKITEEHAKTHFKSSEATKVTDVLPLEPPCNLLEVPEIKRRQSRTLLEETKLVAANTELNYQLGPKEDNFIIPNVINQNANLKINELKAIETLVVNLEEAAQKSSVEFKIDEMKTKTSIADNLKTVAQKVEVSAAESEESFSDVSEAFLQSASLTVQSLAALAQTAVIPTEEVKTGAKSSELSSHNAKILLQESTAAHVLQINALSSSINENFEISKNLKKVETAVESSETVTAKVSEIEVKEAKCEITEIEDESSYADVQAQYTVELAHEETDVPVDASAELKIVNKQAVKEQQEDITATLEIDTQYIQKDIEYMENGMTSIIQSVDADLQASKLSKKFKKSFKVEAQIVRNESSKSPSPDTPVIDVYFFRVDTPHERKREISSEVQSTELDYRSVKKRRYTQAEMSIAQSIGIEYQISDSDQESESEYMEIEYVDEAEYIKRQSTKLQAAVALDQRVATEEAERQVSQSLQSSQNKHKSSKHKRSEASIAVSARQENASLREQSSASIEVSRQSNQAMTATSITASAEHLSVSGQSANASLEVSQQSCEASIAGSLAVSAKQEQIFNATQNSYESAEISQQRQSAVAVRRKKKHMTASALQSSHVSVESHEETNQEASAVQVGSTRKSTNIQELEVDSKSLQKDINVIEMEIESRHAKLSSVDAHAIKLETSKTRIDDSNVSIQDVTKSPSPPIEPPTPLTDEYMFRLVAPLPSREGTPVPRDCTDSSESEEEVLKKKLIPHIDLTIEQRIFDPPLPTPPTSPERRAKPFYTKPGLRGGGDKLDITKEEILEIGRQSTLLASAIEETLQSIQQYKTEAGINTNQDMDYTYSSSEKTSECKAMEFKEYKSEDAMDKKVEVLIDKMIETSRRFSGDAGENVGTAKEEGKERIIPISQDTLVTAEKESSSQVASSATLEEVKDRKMDRNNLCDQLMRSVQSMIDPNATVEERLKQLQSQIAELSRLPDVIQKTLEDVKVQFVQLNQQVQQKTVEIQMSQSVQAESHQQYQVSEQIFEGKKEESETQKPIIIEVTESESNGAKSYETNEPREIIHSVEEDMEIQNIIEKRRMEAENKVHEELMKERLSQELRIAKERLSPKPSLEGRSTPNLGLPERLIPNLGLQERASPKLDIAAGPAFHEPARPVTPKMWKKLDTYDDANLEQALSETLAAQAEVIQGKAIGVNFKKYEKPPPPLDHLQHSEVYKAIHDMDQKPLKKVELLKPAIAASDYVERLRSVSPSPAKTFIEDCEV